MKSYFSVAVVTLGLAFSLWALEAAQKKELAAGPAKSTKGNRILRVQLFLDGSDFKPGAIDGRWGEFTRKALSYYDTAQGKSGQNYGEKEPEQFDLPLDEARPAVVGYKLTADDAQFVGELPASTAAKAKLERLPYETLLELVAEKFHARADFLREINPGYDWANAKPGDEVQVPNVTTPFELREAMEMKRETEKAEKNGTLRTQKDKPESERYSIFIDVSEKILELKQGEKVVGSYPITPGSDSLPAPKGDWFVRGFSWMPTFRWDEAMLQSGERSADAYHLPPGPNNPVGIIWMELSHDGSGIHGTEAPETIGRTTSHGCIRLSNWNALELGKKVLPGVHVVIP